MKRLSTVRQFIDFGRGAGQDVVLDSDWAAGNIDTIKLATGVLPSDVTLVRQNNDLVLSIAGTTDTLTGTDGDSVLMGYDGNDTLLGKGGNDFLNGGAGNDSLDGGVGADMLIGGTGNDTYLFGSGAGQDMVYDADSSIGNTDQIVVGADIASNQLWFNHVGNDLEVSLIGTTDKITVQNWYADGAYRVEQFHTADGMILLDSDVENLVSAMSAFSVTVVGQTTLTNDYDAVLAANWH